MSEERLVELRARIAALQLQFDQIRITGGRDVIVEGEPRRGFKIDIVDDDGSGGEGQQTPGQIKGCTDPTAENYNPEATIDNGTCVYAFGACCVDESCFVDTQRNCNNYGAYQGDNVPCSPNPCLADTGACCDPDGTCTQTTAADCLGAFQGVGTECGAFVCPVIGACCEPDGSCSETTQEACTGDYQGDGTACGAFECPILPCPPIQLLCDQACASATKCGQFNPFDGKYYKNFVTGIHPTGSVSFHVENCLVDAGPPADFDGPLNTSVSWDVYRLTTRAYDDSSGTCHVVEIGPLCGGFSIYTGDNSECLNCGDSESCDYSDCFTYDVGGGYPPCVWASDEPCIFIVTASGCKTALCVYSNRGGTPQFDVAEYSNEYTTAELISHVDGMLSFPGTFTGGCSASRNLTSNEAGYSACRFQYKFQFTAQAFDMVIHWTESGPDGDNGFSESVPAGATETTVHTCFEPSVNGSTTIRDITCEAV